VQPKHVDTESGDPLEQGIQAIARGDSAQALSYFEQAVKAKPGRPAAYLRAANLLRDLDRLDEAEAKYRAALAVAPDHVPALLGLVSIARARNDGDAALRYLQNAQAAAPDNPKILLQLGNMLRSYSRWAEAQAVYESLLEEDPSNAKAMAFLGQIAQNLGETDKAIAWFRQAVEIDANAPNAAASLAELLSGPEQAREGLAKRTRADARNERLKPLWHSVRAARKAGNDAAACELLRAASLTEPDSTEILVELGATYRKLGRMEDAAAVYRDVISRDAQNAKAYLGLGIIARAYRDDVGALAHFTTAAEIEPDNLQTLLSIAELLVTQNRSEDADAICQSVLAKSPQDPKVLAALGVVAQKNKNWNAALAFFQAAAAVDPSKMHFRVQLGRAYNDLLRLDEAEQTFRSILENAPDNVEATIGLGETVRLRGDSKAALVFFEAAARLAPFHPTPKAAIRRLESITGEFDWRAEIDEAVAVAHNSDAPLGAQISAATLLIEYGITELASPVLARLQSQSPAARQLIFAVREIERMGLAQPLRADDAAPDSDDSQLDSLQGFHEKPAPGSDTLLLVFAGRNNRVWMTFSLLHRILRSTGVSVVYARDLQQTWYTQGVVGLGSDYESTVEAFRTLAARYGARRILALGNCSGCLGALRFGLSLGAQGVLGIAPNVRPIGTLKPEYMARVESIRKLLPANRKDMHTQYLEAQSKPNVSLIYGEQCAPDAADAQFMADVPGVKIAGMPDVVNHDAIKDLLARGLLEPLLREFVAKGDVSAETLERIATSKSP